MQVRVNPTGNIDKDVELSYISKGNYEDANDIRHRQTDGSNFGGIMGIKGNDLKITIPTAASSTKLYRVYIRVSGIITSPTVPVDNNDGVIVFEDTSGTKTTVSAVLDQNQSLANYASALQSLITAAGGGAGSFFYSSLTSITSTYGYFEFSQNAITDNEYVIYHISEAGKRDLAEIVLIRDFISDIVDFTVIGSAYYNEDLFLFSASEDVDYPSGQRPVSEIGVVYYDNANDAYSYTRLLRTRELGFTRENRFEIELEASGNRISLYATDNNSYPRSFYINRPDVTGNPYSTDQMLSINGGDYNLSTVGFETQLFMGNPNSRLSVVEVREGSGSLTTGSKRYTGCFISSGTKSEYLYPTNQVNIYTSSFSKPYEISGNAESEVSDKSVILNIDNIPADVYDFFELVVIEYSGLSVSAKTVQRYAIGNGQTSLSVEHSDIGQDNIPLSINEVIAITSKYNKVATLKLFDNRLTASNLTEQVDLNLSEWASQIKHSIEQKDLNSIGLMGSDFNTQEPSYSFGEYMDPLNVYHNSGYMLHDTYRFGIQVKDKLSGKWSAPYWVDDIRFDFLSYNVTDDSANPSSWRRTANNIDQNLTKGITTGVGSNSDTDYAVNTRAYYVSFSNINMDYVETTTGKKIRDLISAFRIVRAERIPEVLATGILTVAYVDSLSTYVPWEEPFDRISLPPASGMDYGFFLSPDIYFGTTKYTYINGDKLKVCAPFRGPNNVVNGPGRSDTGQAFSSSDNYSRYVDYAGYFDSAKFSYTDVTISDHVELSSTNKFELPNGSGVYVSRKITDTSTTPDRTRIATYQHAFKFPSSIFGSSGGFGNVNTQFQDSGMYYAQIFRDLGANQKYPKNKELTVYNSTGHLYVLSGIEAGTLTQSVFGGDTFTQKTHMQMYYSDANPVNASYGGVGCGFYSQNITNTQMRAIEEHNLEYSGPGYLFPQYTDKNNDVSIIGLTPSFNDGSWGAGLIYWLEQWPEVSNQNVYNKGYSWRDDVMVEIGYDENNTYNGRKPATITWSAKKTVGSKADAYRIFQPLDFADLDLTYGEIAHHDVINNAFYTWQDYSFQRQYFRDASLIGADTGSDIVVGSGSILGAPGVELTSIGSNKKWSIIKGNNPDGKETAYWYNDRLQKIVRLAGNGIDVISNRGLMSFLINNGKYGRDDYKPLAGKGIHAVWNDKYSEAIFTFKYRKPGEETDSAFTLVYDEINGGFSSFHSYYPNIYLRYGNTFFSTKPDEQNKVYLHDSGSESTYYGTKFYPNITMVMNYDLNTSKIFEAVQVVSDKQPYRIDFTVSSKNGSGNNYVSYLEQGDFEQREDLWYSSIKNESNTTGLNSDDTSRLFGKWLKMKLSLRASGDNQKLLNTIVKFRPNPRLYNT